MGQGFGVELEHRHIERHDRADDVLKGIESPGGWSGILARYSDKLAS